MCATNSVRKLAFLTLMLFIASIGYSAYARSLVLTPKSLCAALQAGGFTKGCQEGSPWAFETIRFSSQYSFEPTQPEIFKCYTVSDGHTHVPCLFKGAVKQFKDEADLHAGLSHIRRQNYREHLQSILNANVVRADTTLEHYIFYKSAAEHILIILPVTEGMSPVLSMIAGLGLVEVDE